MGVENINDRIIDLIEVKGLNPSQFAKSLGYSRADKIYNIVNKSTGVSLDIVQDIATHHKDISIEWLLIGDGNMFKDKSQSVKLINTKSDHDLLRDVQVEGNISNVTTGFDGNTPASFSFKDSSLRMSSIPNRSLLVRFMDIG